MAFDVQVIDLDNVTVDGTPSGSVTDVLYNYYDPTAAEGMKAAVLAAIHAWHDAKVAGLEASAASAKEASDAELSAKGQEITDLRSAVAAAEAATAAAERERDLANEGRNKTASEKASLAEQVSALTAELATEKTAHADQVSSLTADLAAQTTQITALGGETLAQTRAKEARKQALLAELATLQGGV